MLILQVVSDCSSLVLFNSLVKVSARVADITCITQVTLKMINNALLIHKGWLVFPHFDFVLDLSTCVNRPLFFIEKKGPFLSDELKIPFSLPFYLLFLLPTSTRLLRYEQ